MTRFTCVALAAALCALIPAVAFAAEPEPACPGYDEPLNTDVVTAIRCSPFKGARISYLPVDFDHYRPVLGDIAELEGLELPTYVNLQIEYVRDDVYLNAIAQSDPARQLLVRSDKITIIVREGAEGTSITYNRIPPRFPNEVRVEVPSQEVKEAWEAALAAHVENQRIQYSTLRYRRVWDLRDLYEANQAEAEAERRVEDGTLVVIPE